MQRPQGMPQQVNIDPNTLDDIVCKAGAMTPIGQCGNQYFKQVLKWKKHQKQMKMCRNKIT